MFLTRSAFLRPGHQHCSRLQCSFWNWSKNSSHQHWIRTASAVTVSSGVCLAWYLWQNPGEPDLGRQKLLLDSFRTLMPSVSAASVIEDADAVADKDINDDDPKSKAHEIKSLDMRKKHNFIADVVDQTAPAVVYIEIKDNRRKDYFGKPATLSNGSGFIVKEDGLILTNAHVVVRRPYATVLVKLHVFRLFEGYVEDVDMKSDLATVRIPCKNLPVLRLGSSTQIRPGEWVVAMGSPLSLSNTITVGVVSSISRGSEELGLKGKEMDYIQTDAAITFGNSGGPLVNLDGEAIGINSMKVAAGISFAIPIDYGKAFLKQAEARKSAEGRQSWFGSKRRSEDATPKRRYMGVTMLTLTPRIIQELQTRGSNVGPEVTHGVLIWKVVVDSPAHSGGLLPGDVITSVNGKEVVAADDVYKALNSSERLQMEVARNRERLHLTVVPDAN